jgi:hypothetical protein
MGCSFYLPKLIITTWAYFDKIPLTIGKKSFRIYKTRPKLDIYYYLLRKSTL